MDSAFCTLMIVLIAAGVNGIKVLVSIPEGELTEAIKNATKQETKTLKRELKSMKNHESESIAKLERELKSIKALLKQINGSASKTEPKPKLNPTSEPTPEPTSEPTPEPTPEPDRTTEPEPKQVQTIIPIGDGKKRWDSDFNSHYTVDDAFSDNVKVYGCAGYSASANGWTQPFPIMIWVEFPTTHVPSKFLFRRIDTSKTPKMWRFVGSNEEGCTHDSTWKSLCGDMFGDTFAIAGDIIGCEVKKNAREPFKCLGIRVYTNNFSDNAICVQAMSFWENTSHLTSRA